MLRVQRPSSPATEHCKQHQRERGRDVVSGRSRHENARRSGGRRRVGSVDRAIARLPRAAIESGRGRYTGEIVHAGGGAGSPALTGDQRVVGGGADWELRRTAGDTGGIVTLLQTG